MLSIGTIEYKLFLQEFNGLSKTLSYDCRLRQLWCLIQEKFSDPGFTLPIAAKTCGMSVNNLNLVLNARSGLTCHQLLTRYRVYRACEMFREENHGVLNVALQTGFNSLTSFGKAFKRHLRLTPKEFRKVCSQQSFR